MLAWTIYLDQEGHLGGSVVEHLPLAQVMILESQDRVPYPAGSLLLLLPVSLPLSLSLSLCVS